jgi:glycosyltransferase involved in cell wall biosynthesis
LRIGIYLADQVWERTRSKGIYSYSRLLARELPPRLAGHDVTLFVNRANRADMDAGVAARVIELPAACASGAPRLFADNVAAPWLAARAGLDLVHFPKGFVPWLGSGRRFTVTIHDTIPLYYAREHAGEISRVHLAYLAATIRRGLRRARAVVTDSAFSRSGLLAEAARAGMRPPTIEVCPLTPAPELVDPVPTIDGSGEPRLLHIGSPMPHKRTAETIALFRAFNRRRGGKWRLRVTGLAGSSSHEDVVFLGPLPVAALREELRAARALLFLSAIEGFGLPALEAWFLGTPVCHAGGGAIEEILQGIPGACGRLDEEGFTSALDGLLALSIEERRQVRDRLRRDYGREAFLDRMADLVSGFARPPRAAVAPRVPLP